MGLFVLQARGGPGCLLPPASHGKVGSAKSVPQSRAGVFRARNRAGASEKRGARGLADRRRLC